MFEDYENRKRKQVSLMKSLLDYGMGIVIALAGLFFLFRGQFDLALNTNYPPNNMDKMFGVMAFLYGCWRIYRGYKQNYFK